MGALHTEQYKGYTIKLYQDELEDGPRDWDNLGTMVCWHRRYDLGDEQEKGDPQDWLDELASELDPTVEDRLWYWEDGNGWAYCANTCEDPISASDAQQRAVVARVLDQHIAVMLPLYLYDHGSISMSTGRAYPFNCPWDSGQVGWIYVTKDQLREEYSKQRLSRKTLALAAKVLRSEVKVYDQYLRGDVYFFSTTDQHGATVDGCGGIYGWDYALKYARSELDAIIAHKWEQLEQWEVECYATAGDDGRRLQCKSI